MKILDDIKVLPVSYKGTCCWFWHEQLQGVVMHVNFKFN